MPKRVKRVSHEVDKLVAEVDRLTNHPDPHKRLSVNKACAKVGLQNTVYYFRKRKEAALEREQNEAAHGFEYEASPARGPSKQPPAKPTKQASSDDLPDDVEDLWRELKWTENRLRAIKIKLSENLKIF